MAFALAEIVYSRRIPDYPLEDWVKMDIYDTAFFSYLLDTQLWLSDEFGQLLKSMLDEQGLLQIKTCVPDQFFIQWYANKFRACMDLFEAEHHEHPVVQQEPFEAFFKFTQRMMKSSINFRVATQAEL